MTNSDIFAEDFKTTPYWWETAAIDRARPGTLPERADVAIIGAGYTGLSAAIETARAGLSTVVIEAEALGHGCSTRNGGQISTSVKPSYARLAKRYGETLASDILAEGQASLEHIARFVETEKIACNFKRCGRFHGAHTARQYDQLARECERSNPVFSTDTYMVPKSEQHHEIGTDAYFGGMVSPHHASVDPGRYFAGLVDCAETSGAKLFSHMPVMAIERESGGFRVKTATHALQAARVVLATNGYTGALAPWHRRRVIPIGSYVIATEPIEPELMDRLMPTDRVFSDSRKLVYYYRPSPDRRRILFGGRVSLAETDPRKSAVKLRDELVRLLPQLRDIRVSHSWMGFVAYTFDTLMHTGHDRGFYHAMGYCGSGVGMASYLGMRVGRQAAGLREEASAFNRIPFQTRPLYTGSPWFLAPSVLVYRIRDRLGV